MISIEMSCESAGTYAIYFNDNPSSLNISLPFWGKLEWKQYRMDKLK